MGASGNYEIIVFGVVLVLVLKVRATGWGLHRPAPPGAPRAVDWRDAPPACRAEKPPHGALVLDVAGRAQGVRRPGGGQRHQLPGARRRDPRPDRPQRGRQVDDLQPASLGCSQTRGEVLLGGEAGTGLPSREIARRGVARTFQHVKMIPTMTVLENVPSAPTCAATRVACAMLRLDRDEEPPPAARGRAPAHAASAWLTACTTWPATCARARKG